MQILFENLKNFLPTEKNALQNLVEHQSKQFHMEESRCLKSNEFFWKDEWIHTNSNEFERIQAMSWVRAVRSDGRLSGPDSHVPYTIWFENEFSRIRWFHFRIRGFPPAEKE